MENQDNKTSHTALVVRYRSWFRPFLAVEELPRLARDELDSITLTPFNHFRTRVLVGRGPLEHSLVAIPQLWFGQGQSNYPVYTSPNTSPSGAGLFATNTPRTIEIGDQEAVCVVESCIVYLVADDFMTQLGSGSEDAPPTPDNPLVSGLLHEVQRLVEKAVGVYALGQYPLVWEPIAVEPMASVIDLDECKLRNITRFPIDHQIPFRLNICAKLKGNHLADGALTNFTKIEHSDLHLPLMLLQRMLWQKNVELRFLEAFWLLDFLASQHKAIDHERSAREQMYSLMQKFFTENHPEFKDRVESLKHVVLQAPQKSRIESYFKHLGIGWNTDLMRRITAIRNALAHARSVDSTELSMVASQTVLLARKVMQHELKTRGFRFDGQDESAD